MPHYTLRYDTPDKPQPAYVTMIVAGGLVPRNQQAINNHHDISYAEMVLH